MNKKIAMLPGSFDPPTLGFVAASFTLPRTVLVSYCFFLLTIDLTVLIAVTSSSSSWAEAFVGKSIMRPAAINN